MLTSVGESPANYLPPNKILIPFIVIVVESFFPPKVLPSGVVMMSLVAQGGTP